MDNLEAGVLYFNDGELVANSGSARVYKMNGELFLEIGDGHTLWALEREVLDYIDQLGDKPKGNALEIGLGLGVASRCILTYPKVKKLTTVEKNMDVINTHEQLINYLDGAFYKDKWSKYDKTKHNIVNNDGLNYLYTTKEKYDFIFMDFYSHIDEDTLPDIADMVIAARRVLRAKGVIMGWLDPYTPDIFVEQFKNLFK